MKMLNRYIAFLILLCPVVAFAGTNDNKILLDQSGDTLNLTIDQIGYGNKLCGTITGGDCASDWILTGSSVTMDIDMIGNLNQIFGPTLFDSTDVDLSLTGNSNIWDWNVGYGGSADSSVVDVAITGSSNTFDIDWGYQSDGAYQSITMEWIGSSGDIDILQTSGTCGGSITACYGIINADFDSENAVVNIKQKDTTD